MVLLRSEGTLGIFVPLMAIDSLCENILIPSSTGFPPATVAAAQSAASSASQERVAQGNPFAAATNSSHAFTFVIEGTPAQPAGATVTFTVPLHLPSTRKGLSDLQIIENLRGIGTNPDQWKSTSHDNKQGGKTLIFIRRDSVLNPAAPRVRLHIGSDNVLQLFTINDLNKPNAEHSVQFHQRRIERAPGWIAPGSGGAVTGMQRQTTLPLPPPAAGARGAADPLQPPWSHAALQRHVLQAGNEISDAIREGLAWAGMRWETLSPGQQIEVWFAANRLPPQAPAGTREQQIRAALSRILLTRMG